MESKNSNEAKFDSFLTKTIILSSKKYFKKQIDMSSKEQTIFDDEGYCAFVESFFVLNNGAKNDYERIDISLSIKDALNSLSAIEQAVIFCYFKKNYHKMKQHKFLKYIQKPLAK